MSAIVVIPARLMSERLPRKMLADIMGKPLIQHVYESVSRAKLVEKVIVATDSEEISQAVESYGGNSIMTDPSLPSGTARIASIINQLDHRNIINVQGDLPLIQEELIDQVINCMDTTDADIVTPVWPITEMEDLKDPGCVKVAIAFDGKAVYFSRNAIPFVRDHRFEDWLKHSDFWGHYGIYGYRKKVLIDIAEDRIPTSKLEEIERLEQLAFLEAGYKIYTIKTTHKEIPIDTAEELEYVRQVIRDQ